MDSFIAVNHFILSIFILSHVSPLIISELTNESFVMPYDSRPI